MNKPCCTHASDAPIDGCASHQVVQVVVRNEAARSLLEKPLSERGGTQEAGYVGPSVPLTQLRVGQAAVVRSIDMDVRDASMLRAMGLRVNARVRICRLGEPCIIELLGGSTPTSDATADCPRGAACTCRLGLAKPLAQRVMVGVA